MRIRERALALAAVCLLAADVAFAEIGLFDIQKDLLLGKTTIAAPSGTQEADLAAIVACLKGKKDITLDLSGTGIKAIPDSVFKDCTALKSVILPKGLSSIGDSAFYRCESLTSVVIPESVTSIGERAFNWCDSLTSVEIPEGVASIGADAFLTAQALPPLPLATREGGMLTRGSPKLWRRGSLHRV